MLNQSSEYTGTCITIEICTNWYVFELCVQCVCIYYPEDYVYIFVIYWFLGMRNVYMCISVHIHLWMNFKSCIEFPREEGPKRLVFLWLKKVITKCMVNYQLITFWHLISYFFVGVFYTSSNTWALIRIEILHDTREFGFYEVVCCCHTLEKCKSIVFCWICHIASALVHKKGVKKWMQLLL